MNISNFKLTEIIGKSALTWKFRATVTVTTKKIFRKQIVEKREVFKEYAGSWYFVDTGEFTPKDVDRLSRKFEAEKGADLQDCFGR